MYDTFSHFNFQHTCQPTKLMLYNFDHGIDYSVYCFISKNKEDNISLKRRLLVFFINVIETPYVATILKGQSNRPIFSRLNAAVPHIQKLLLLVFILKDFGYLRELKLYLFIINTINLLAKLRNKCLIVMFETYAGNVSFTTGQFIHYRLIHS